MPDTPVAGLPYPASGAAPNVPADIQALAVDLDTKVIVPVANQTARDALTGTAGLVVFRQDTGDYEGYYGGSWSRIAGPLRQAKTWRTGSTGTVSVADTYQTVDFTNSRVSGGMTFNNTDNKVTLAQSGYYAVEGMGTLSASSGYTGRFRLRRERSGTTDKDLAVGRVIRKIDANDEFDYFFATLPLQISDQIYMQVSMGSTAGRYLGTDEAFGVWMSVRYVGPLSGATPY